MEVLKFKKDTVLIKDGRIKVWIDVWIENEDLICDWNQNMFLNTNRGDMLLRRWQNKLTNFEEASSLAIKTLENAGIIFQNKKAKWQNVI